MKALFRRIIAGALLLSTVAAALSPAESVSAAPPLDADGLSGSEFHKLVSSEYHTAAIKSDGTVWTWGRNLFGQLGYGYSGLYPRQVELRMESGAVDVAVGGKHTMVLMDDGTVWAWGADYDGQLGNNDWGVSYDVGSPEQVYTWDGTALGNITAIAAGANHSLALDRSGRLWAWGNNTNGQLGTGDTSIGWKARLVRKPGGEELSGVTEIQAGTDYSMALAGGRVYTWGSTEDGQLGRTVSETVYTQYAVAVPELTDIGHIYSGPSSRFGFAVSAVTDAVYGWGDNIEGQLGVNSETDFFEKPQPIQGLPSGSRVVSMAAGAYHSAALVQDGTGTRFFGSGGNYQGQLGRDWHDEPRSTAVFAENPALTGMKGLSGGTDHTFVLKPDGKVYAFGDNANLQLGIGITDDDVYRTDLPVKPLSDEGRAVFGGIIRDINTGLPVQGAAVTLEQDYSASDGGIRAVSGEDGRFSFKGLVPRPHKVMIEADGYEFRDDDYWGEVVEIRSGENQAGPIRTYHLTPQGDPTLSSFYDYAPERGIVEGVLDWYSYDYEAVYSVWFVDADGYRIGAEPIGTVSSGEDGVQRELYVSRRALPYGASGIRMFRMREDGIAPTGGWAAMIDFASDEQRQDLLRLYDMNAAPDAVNPKLKWKHYPWEEEIAGYRLFRFNFGGEYLSPQEPSSPEELLPHAGVPFSYYPISEIAEIPKSAAGFYDANLTVEKNDRLMMVPVDAYGHYGPFYRWRLFYIPDNTAGAEHLPEVAWNDAIISPKDVIFYDEDPDLGQIGGSVSWTDISGSGAEGYAIYAVDADGKKLMQLGQVYGEDRYDVPSDTVLPPGTAGIGVAASDYYGREGRMEASSTVPILEVQAGQPQPASVSFADIEPDRSVLEGTVEWSGTSGSSLLRYEVYLLNQWGLPVRTLGIVDAGNPTRLSISDAALPYDGTWFVGVAAVSDSGRSKLTPGTLGLGDIMDPAKQGSLPGIVIEQLLNKISPRQSGFEPYEVFEPQTPRPDLR